VRPFHSAASPRATKKILKVEAPPTIEGSLKLVIVFAVYRKPVTGLITMDDTSTPIATSVVAAKCI
jgi:hypothetical protein